MSINATKWTCLTFCFCVPSSWPPFIPFPLSPLHLESILLEMKDLLFMLLGFPRHASLRGRSPECSEPYVTLDPSKFADQNHIRSSYFFLPRFSLESTPYSAVFQVYLKNCLSHRYAAPRDETTCACFHLQRKLSEELSWDLFKERILA